MGAINIEKIINIGEFYRVNRDVPFGAKLLKGDIVRVSYIRGETVCVEALREGINCIWFLGKNDLETYATNKGKY